MNFKSLSILDKNLLMVGCLTGTFSLDGSLKLKPYLIDSNLFIELILEFHEKFLPIFLYNQPHFPKKTNILYLNDNKKDIIVKFKDIKNIEEANFYINSEIYIDKDYYFDFLKKQDSPYLFLDFKVIFDSKELGVIKTILLNGTQFLFKIIGVDDKEILVPYVKDYIRDIDFEKKYINLNLPEGFLDIYEI